MTYAHQAQAHHEEHNNTQQKTTKHNILKSFLSERPFIFNNLRGECLGQEQVGVAVRQSGAALGAAPQTIDFY
jgi:hypothetical protein